MQKTDSHCLIHLQSFPANSNKAPAILSLSQILDQTQSKDMNFVKIHNISEIETRNRAVLIALMTCKYLRGPQSFVRMYTQE